MFIDSYCVISQDGEILKHNSTQVHLPTSVRVMTLPQVTQPLESSTVPLGDKKRKASNIAVSL